MTILNKSTLSNNAKLFIGIVIGLVITGLVLHFLGVHIQTN